MVMILAVGLWNHKITAATDVQDLAIIVHQDGTDVELFFSMPAVAMNHLFGKDLTALFSDNGKVPLERFREFGSFDLADTLFTQLRAKSGGEIVPLEAMSLMVHPKDIWLPFETPFDGTTAVSVCAFDYLTQRLKPETSRLFYGAFASGVSERATFQLTFPKTGRRQVTVQVRAYLDGEHVKTDHVQLDDGGTISIEWPHSLLNSLDNLASSARKLLMTRFFASE